MKMTDDQKESLRVAFSNKFTDSMSECEFDEYLLRILTLSLSTAIVKNGVVFVTGLVNSALEGGLPLPCITKTDTSEEFYMSETKH